MEPTAGKQPYRFVILGLTCAIAFMGNYLQYQVSALAVGVMAALSIDTAGFQLLFLTPMLAAVLFSVPFGVAGDKLGPKRVVAAAFLIALVGSLARLVDLSSFSLQLASMFAVGIGMTALTANNAKTLGLWFGEKTGFAMGLYYAFSCLGISASQATAGLMGSIEASYLSADLALGAVVALWMALGRNAPAGTSVPRDAASAPAFGQAARSRNVWLIALATGLALAATTGYAGILPQALEFDRGLSTAAAGQMASLLTLASMVGCVVAPVICARFRSTRAYLLAMAVVGAVVMAATWLLPSTGLLPLLLLNGFATSLLGPVLQALPITLPGVGPRYAGSAGGIIAEVSLLLSFALPIAASLMAGFDYALNLTLLSGIYALALVPLAMLPRLSRPLGGVGAGTGRHPGTPGAGSTPECPRR